MKRTIITIALAGVLPLAAVAQTSAAGSNDDQEVYCHGQIATYVGTAGNDDIDDAHGDFGRNPVIVLGDGSDRLRLGLGYLPALDSLTVCGGSGQDSIEVSERIGDHAQTLLDGGLDDDFVGNQGGLNNSDLAKLVLVGGAGEDVLRGANGNDEMDAGKGDDSLYGVGGKDKMKGGSGNDILRGQRGSDLLKGGSGFDLLEGDMPGYPDGRDVADGGSNRDRCEAEVVRNCES